MVGLGALELLVMALVFSPVSGGAVPIDLAVAVEPDAYFASRQVVVGAKRMGELAASHPTDGRGTLQQLLAIRWLGDHKDRLGDQRDAVRQLLVRLAAGQDEFARDYARVALARIDGRWPDVGSNPPRGDFRDLLAWFPQEVDGVVAFDFRTLTRRGPSGAATAPDLELDAQFRRLSHLMFSFSGDVTREPLYQFAEAVGNFRIDRLALGMAPEPERMDKVRLFLRISGRIDQKRLAAYLRANLDAESALLEQKDAHGEPILIFGDKAFSGAVALIGDHDLILASYLEDGGNSKGLLEDMLAARAGTRPSVLTGPLRESLRDLPPDARGVVRALLPHDLRAPVARSSLGAAPRAIAADLLPLTPSPLPLSPAAGERGRGEGVSPGVELRLRGTFDDAFEARKFADEVRHQRGQLVEALKQLPLSVSAPVIALVSKLIEEIEINDAGTEVRVRVRVPSAALRTLLQTMEAAIRGNLTGGDG